MAFIFHAQLVHIVMWQWASVFLISMIQIDPAHDLHPARTHLSHCIAVSAFYLLLSMTSSLSGSHFSCPSTFEGLPIQSFSARIVFAMSPKRKSKLKDPMSYTGLKLSSCLTYQIRIINPHSVLKKMFMSIYYYVKPH